MRALSGRLWRRPGAGMARGMGAACEASAVRYTAARLAHARRRRQEALSVAQAHPGGSGTRGRPWAPCGASEASGACCGLWPVRGRPGALITARDAGRDPVSPQSRRPVATYTRVPGHASACDGCRVADTDPPAFFIRHDFPRRATGRVIQNGSFRAYTTVGTGLVLSVYIFLSCIQIVVIGKRRPDLWITTYTSDRSRTCVYGKHRDGVLAGGDDSAIGMRAGEVYLQLVPYTSPSQPQGTHTESAYFSTAAGVVIHIARISPPPSQPFPNVIRKISEFILI